MKPYVQILMFDRPLGGATVAGHVPRIYSEVEVEAIRTEAYRKGHHDARAGSDQQLVEFRSEVQQLQEGIFLKLTSEEVSVIKDLRASLPSLAIELAHRLLAGFEPSADVISRLCEEVLEQVSPEKDNLELSVCPRDAELLTDIMPQWSTRFPNLRIRPDQSLTPGDCKVRSRFGLTDARKEAKLGNLEQSLTV